MNKTKANAGKDAKRPDGPLGKFSAAQAMLYDGEKTPPLAVSVRIRNATELLAASFPKANKDSIDWNAKLILSIADRDSADPARLIDALYRIDNLATQSHIIGKLDSLLSYVLPANPEYYKGSIADRIFLVEKLAVIWKEELLDRCQPPSILLIDDKEIHHYQEKACFWTFVREIDTTHRIPKSLLKSEKKTMAEFEAYLRGKQLIYGTEPQMRGNPAKCAYDTALHSLLGRFGYSLTSREADRALKDIECLNLLAAALLPHEKSDAVASFFYTVSCYMRNHDFRRDWLKGALFGLLPKFHSNESNAEVLFHSRNSWGMHLNDWGISDFTCLCYSLRVSPRSINRAILALRQVPASDFAKFETNRLDSRSIGGILREAVHDQRPNIHGLLAAMVAYYDDPEHDPLPLRVAISKVDYARTMDTDWLFELKTYSLKYSPSSTTPGPIQDQSGNGEYGIDILRRLERNTRPVQLIPTNTSRPELNSRMQELFESGPADRNKLEQALKCANGILLRMIKEKKFGIEPSLIEALSWLEHQAFMALQSVNFEEQCGIHKSGWFQEVLLFNDLSFSANTLSKREFGAFIHMLEAAESHEEARRMIFDRVIGNLYGLARIYSREENIKMRDALWSGNISHELLGLMDLRPAATAIGGKYSRELSKPPWERNNPD